LETEGAIQKLLRIPEGYSTGYFQNLQYKIIKTSCIGGRSQKIEALQMGGNDYISCNIYFTTDKVHFKPCEMPLDKILDFILGFSLQPEN